MADTEKEKEDMKAKVAGQRHKLEYLHKAKKQVEDNLNKMKVSGCYQIFTGYDLAH